MNRTPPSKRDRFLGCMLGLALGDALGAPFEGLSGETIYRDFGPSRRVMRQPPVEVLHYTDDTQMALGVAECLVETGGIDQDALATRFLENYQPDRGYGPGARRILDAMTDGDDWRAVTASVFPGGSLGNGAAMRVAPVGLAFHSDLDRVVEQAGESARVTHIHPIGVDGAVVVATAVALLVGTDAFDPQAFYAELSRRATTEEFRWQLAAAARLTADDTIRFGNSLEAHRSVTTSVACFALSPDSFSEAVSGAIAFGGDTDTLAAMTGALSGAYLGAGALPGHLLGMLEGGPKGRAYIERLAGGLYDRFVGFS